jgi:hypothetical protein
VDEIRSYNLTTTPWGGTPTDPVVKVFSVIDGDHTDVSTTVMPTNSPSISGDVITLSPLKSLTEGIIYRMEILFVTGGNTEEPYCMIQAER